MTCRPYGTKWDDVVRDFIASREPFPGYWEISEEGALGLVDRVVEDTTKVRMLDLGCGKGRLLGRFGKSFAEVVAVDPDAKQISNAQELAKQVGLKRIEYHAEPFEACYNRLGRPFDFVVCSHVIQHLQTGAVAPFIELARSVLSTTGLLILLTAHSECEHDRFKVWQATNGPTKVTEIQLINEAAFDSLLDDGCPEDWLPTHAFSTATLRGLLSGYRILKLRYFHALNGRNVLDSGLFAALDRFPFGDKSVRIPPCRDKWVNVPPFRGRYGIDLLAILSRG